MPLTLPVTLPVQPPPEGSEIKWSAELETLPLLVRWLDFTISNRCFPPLCIDVIISECLPCKPGCGGYADNSSGAVSCTGHGESILKVTLARLILSHMEQGSGDTLHGRILCLTNKQFHLHAFFFTVRSQGNPRRSLHSWLCSTWASVCAAQEESSWCLHQDSGQLNLLQ